MNANEKRQFAIKYAQYERLLILQGYAKATRDNYQRSLRRLADWADQCPDQRLKKKDFEFSKPHANYMQTTWTHKLHKLHGHTNYINYMDTQTT